MLYELREFRQTGTRTRRDACTAEEDNLPTVQLIQEMNRNYRAAPQSVQALQIRLSIPINEKIRLVVECQQRCNPL